MTERKNITAVAGTPLTLLGEEAKVGAIAPDFTAINIEGQEVKFSDFKGKIIVITSFPSIDTPVCDSQAREFNKRATALGDDVVVLTISKDLPFALGRFCAAAGIKNITTLSDHAELDFANKYGFLIKENKLLARGTVIVGKDGRIAYVEYVDDITKEPNYDAAIEVIKGL